MDIGNDSHKIEGNIIKSRITATAEKNGNSGEDPMEIESLEG